MKKYDGYAGPMNLGNPVEVTIRELAETIVRVNGSRSEIILQPLPADDPVRRKLDIGVARERLGWEPIADLVKGLAETIDHFSHRLTHEGNSVGS